ncbi:hypothetical protein H4R19_002813 [Coemansia spiralis]|nr:hypothetical protein H4R19_002813 [Coemansia spiralis]
MSGSGSSSGTGDAVVASGARLQQGLVQQLEQLERARRDRQAALADAGRTSDDALRARLRPLVQLEHRAATAAIELVDKMLARLAEDTRDPPSDTDDYRAKRRRTDDRPRPTVDRQRSRDRAAPEPPRDRRRDRSYDRSSGSDRRVRRPDNSGGTVPHRGTRDEEPPRSSSSRSIVARGSLVAARVPTAEQAEEWILATVLSYNADKNRYTVQDYELDSAERPTYTLSPRLVLYVTEPLGTASSARRRAPWDRAARPELGRGLRLLALYPGTTVFYHCTVVVPPSLNTALSGVILPPVRGVPMGPPDVGPTAPPDPATNPMYRVQFDDDGDRQVNVPAHLVVPLSRARPAPGHASQAAM